MPAGRDPFSIIRRWNAGSIVFKAAAKSYDSARPGAEHDDVRALDAVGHRRGPRRAGVLLLYPTRDDGRHVVKRHVRRGAEDRRLEERCDHRLRHCARADECKLRHRAARRCAREARGCCAAEVHCWLRRALRMQPKLLRRSLVLHSLPGRKSRSTCARREAGGSRVQELQGTELQEGKVLQELQGTEPTSSVHKLVVAAANQSCHDRAPHLPHRMRVPRTLVAATIVGVARAWMRTPRVPMRAPRAAATITRAATTTIVEGLSEIDLSRYDAIVLDQYGVLHNGGLLLDGCADALERLVASGKKLVVLSNTSKRRAALVGELPGARPRRLSSGNGRGDAAASTQIVRRCGDAAILTRIIRRPRLSSRVAHRRNLQWRNLPRSAFGARRRVGYRLRLDAAQRRRVPGRLWRRAGRERRRRGPPRRLWTRHDFHIVWRRADRLPAIRRSSAVQRALRSGRGEEPTDALRESGPRVRRRRGRLAAVHARQVTWPARKPGCPRRRRGGAADGALLSMPGKPWPARKPEALRALLL